MEDWPIDPRSLDGARDADNIEHQVGVRPEPRWSDKSADPFKSQEIMAQQRWEIYRKYRYMGNLWEIFRKSTGTMIAMFDPPFFIFQIGPVRGVPIGLAKAVNVCDCLRCSVLRHRDWKCHCRCRPKWGPPTEVHLMVYQFFPYLPDETATQKPGTLWVSSIFRALVCDVSWRFSFVGSSLCPNHEMCINLGKP